MNACPFNRCDGSGYESTCVEPGAGLSGFETWVCECAKRDTIPTSPDLDEAAKCAALGCHGCPACIPGYIP